MIELASASIAELGAALRNGRVRAADLVERAVSTRDEALGARKLRLPERVLGTARERLGPPPVA